MICSADPTCSRPVKVHARRLCGMHYKRLQAAGLPPLDRFAAHIDRSGDCWLWTGRLEKGGYGRWGGALAHRIAWTRENGPIPVGMTIDHRCRTRACVRVAHLRLMTGAANFSDNGHRDRPTCLHGHPWTPANTRIQIRQGHSYRACRACDRRRQREYRRKP